MNKPTAPVTPDPADDPTAYPWQDHHGHGPGVYPVAQHGATVFYDAKADAWHGADGQPAAPAPPFNGTYWPHPTR